MDYLVQWNINIEADSPEDAARQALEIQRDPESIATVFVVKDETFHTTRVDVLNVSIEDITNFGD